MRSRRPGERTFFRSYAVRLATLLTLALVVTVGVGAWFAGRDLLASLDELQRERARSASLRIAQFVETTLLQVRAATIAGAEASELEARHLELVKLLRIAPAVSDAAWLDATGHERVRVSRVAVDAVAVDVDRSREPAVAAAMSGRESYADVVFRRGSEPHVTLTARGRVPGDGIAVADVNLKFAADVVAAIRFGQTGHAYVVDHGGRLIVHPDTSLVLRNADLSERPQVRAALEAGTGDAASARTSFTRDEDGRRIMATHAPVSALGWQVIVEQSVAEALAPLWGSLARTVLLFAAAIVVAMLASFVMARRMAAPVAALADVNREQARFIAAASHDLRQPVHALGLFVAQLEEARDDETRRALLAKISASSDSISDLIESLLDLSRLDAGSVVPRVVDVPLQPIFERVERAFAQTAAAKGLRFRVRPTTLRLRTDPVLIERILLNLASNAVRYTEEGGAVLGARRRGDRVLIQVWDTGVGIAPDEARRVFEEFYRSERRAGGDAKGLGLGLAIVERLAKLLGTAITLRSVPGRGSVFGVTLPLAAATDTSSDEPRVMLAPFAGLPALVVDDDQGARESVAGLLAQWGCEVRTAGSLAGALAVADPVPGVILCDYRMKDETGPEAIAAMRAKWGATIPAVLITAEPPSSVIGVEADVLVLQKPVNPARLRALLQHVTSNVFVDGR